jgi:hypothetical protein
MSLYMSFLCSQETRKISSEYNIFLLRSQETTYITREREDHYINNIYVVASFLRTHAIYQYNFASFSRDHVHINTGTGRSLYQYDNMLLLRS